MLKILMKKQLTEIFRSYFYNPKNNKSRSKAAVAGYIALFVVLMVGVLGGMFTMLALGLCGPLAAVGMDWLYFALMGLLAVLLGAFGSVFNTYSGLYLAKDNDLLLSMPIPVDTLMASRLLSVYLMGFMYSAVVIVPTVIVYWAVAPVTAGAVLGGVLLVLLISVFVLTLACALGWVVAKISLKLKNKSFVTVLVSLVFFGGYYFFYFKAQTLVEDLLANAAVYGERIRGAAYPLYLFGRVSPRLSLFLTILLRFIPRIGREARKINLAQKGIGRGSNQGNVFRRLVNCLRIFSMLITWMISALALESDSMRSRGSLLRGRTAFSIYRFDNRDRAFVIALFSGITLTAMGAILGATTMFYNPRIIWKPLENVSTVTAAGYAALCLLPMGLEFWTESRFHRARREV